MANTARRGRYTCTPVVSTSQTKPPLTSASDDETTSLSMPRELVH